MGARRAVALATAITLVIGIAMLGAGCRRRAYVRAATPASSGGVVVMQPQAAYTQPAYAQPAYAQPTYAEPAYATPAYAEASVQLLYLPVDASLLPLQLVRVVHVQTDDGRQLQLTPSDVVQGLGGRLAVRIPAGITTGTATVYLVNGQTWSTTFHIAAGQIAAGGSQQGPVGDPRCTLPGGTWQGTITEGPGRATVWLEVLGDCRTVRGTVHLESGSGSVDSTIEGTWDPYSYALVARDTQLFNAQPLPGGSFCPTDEYRLQLTPDGSTIQGENLTWSQSCQGRSRVWLVR